MDWISNEALFYGGIFIVALSLVTAIIYLFVSSIGMIRLKAKFNSEYGEKIKAPKMRRSSH